MLRFTEGWVEFMSKRLAKEVAQRVNNTPVGGNKRSKAHDALWNIKYLPRWVKVCLNILNSPWVFRSNL